MAGTPFLKQTPPLRIHLIGVGGAGMSGLAEVLRSMGYSISGSDLRDTPTLRRLRAQGIQVFLGHHPSQIEGADLVVYSSAIPPDNPELLRARERLIPVFHRAEMIAEIMRLKRGIAVFGAHGKTTTTSLIAYLLEHSGYDPTVMIGGRLRTYQGHGKWGGGEFMVVETDESDGSFLYFYPEISVLLNLDEEHLDYWKRMEALEEKVLEFARRTPFYGTLFLCADDPRLKGLVPRIQRRLITFGIREGELRGSVIRYEQEGMVVRCLLKGEEFPPFRLPLFGEHNLSNALAALGVGMAVGLEPMRMFELLEQFPGVERRFEIILEEKGNVVVHDYGHHPTEIATTLSAAGKRFPEPLWVIWQPHRYTRTHLLWDRFKALAHTLRHLIVTEIYSAGEEPIPGVTSERFVEEVRREGHGGIAFVPLNELEGYLLHRVPKPRTLLFFGAGNIGAFAHAFAKVA